MQFSTSTVALWTILSSRAATASGRCFPSAFGIYVRRDGSARYAPRWTREARSVSFRSRSASYSFHVSPSTPGAASRLSAKNASRNRSTLRWWKSAVNFSSFLCLAACRTRSSACVTRTQPCVRCVLCSPTFLLVPALGSTGSAASATDVASALFVGFAATMAECDFSRSCIIGYGSSPSRHGPEQHATYLAVGPTVRSPGSRTRSVRTCQVLRPRRVFGALAIIAPLRFAFRKQNCIGTRNDASFAARWLAYAHPCQRFAETLLSNCA